MARTASKVYKQQGVLEIEENKGHIDRFDPFDSDTISLDELLIKETLGDYASIYEQEAVEELREAVRDAVDGLPEEQRKLIRLVYFEGVSYAEIYRQTGRSISRMRLDCTNAFKNLRKVLIERMSYLSPRSKCPLCKYSKISDMEGWLLRILKERGNRTIGLLAAIQKRYGIRPTTPELREHIIQHLNVKDLKEPVSRSFRYARTAPKMSLRLVLRNSIPQRVRKLAQKQDVNETEIAYQCFSLAFPVIEAVILGKNSKGAYDELRKRLLKIKKAGKLEEVRLS